MQEVVESAPRLMDHLGEESLRHFETVCAILERAGQPFTLNPRLVRGMDYYNLTVFEWVTDRLGAQGTLCGGGRYDTLVEMLGGRPAPGIGWGLGIERVLELLADSGLQAAAHVPDAYCVLADARDLSVATAVAEELRALGLSVVMHAGSAEGWGSMKSQFRRADASGARFALVFGDAERQAGQVSVKPLRDAAAVQTMRPLAQASSWAHELRNA
jgi:histidyl-tRNA synthetase